MIANLKLILELTVVMTIVMIFVPLMVFSSWSNLPPYTSYSYSALSNDSGSVANSAANATIDRTVTEAINSNIAKSETLKVYVQNAGVNALTATVYFNAINKGQVVANASGYNYKTFTVVCLNGVNAIDVGTNQTGNNVTLTNTTLNCATTLHGTDYRGISSLIIVMILFVIIIIAWRTYKIK